MGAADGDTLGVIVGELVDGHAEGVVLGATVGRADGKYVGRLVLGRTVDIGATVGVPDGE